MPHHTRKRLPHDDTSDSSMSGNRSDADSSPSYATAKRPCRDKNYFESEGSNPNDDSSHSVFRPDSDDTDSEDENLEYSKCSFHDW